jgi:hypothetical protein
MPSHLRSGLLLEKQLIDQEGFSQPSPNRGQLKMPSADGKMRDTDTVNTKTVFRIVQSIQSKHAEPFKQWLAEVGAERIEEVNDPEIAIQRAIYNYRSKGHDDEWINKRLKMILSKRDLTSEWQRRGIKDGLQYALLTDSISEGIFGLKTKKHKKVKALKSNHNLRDHMSPVELALTMQGETTTVELGASET